MELMHECFPKHSRMGTARTKYVKEGKRLESYLTSYEEGKKRGMSMEICKAGTK